MGIMDNTAASTNNNSGEGYSGHTIGGATRRNGRTEDRPQAQVWANVGYRTEIETTNGVEEVFIPLPLGIALDTMTPQDERVNSADFAARRQASNHLLARLQEAAKQLAPGESRILKLEVELRRVADKAVADPNTNALIKNDDLF